MTDTSDRQRLGVVGLFIYKDGVTNRVNDTLAHFSPNIRGRLGIPQVEADPPVSVISLIFEGTTDQMGALTGKLGQIDGVEVKSLISKRFSLPIPPTPHEGEHHA